MSKDQCIGFVHTPPLWFHEQFGIRQFEFPDIDLSDFNPETIPYRMRLGHQMEHVFKQLIEKSSQYDILLHNLPIKNGTRTIGEIDFILCPVATGGLLHIELTYKFYIIDTNITEPIHRLMGPNKRDMCFSKMEKIKNQQFPLLHSVEGCKMLEERGINPQKIEHQCCFKAQLFVPFDADSINIRPFNKACIVGYWLRFDAFGQKEFRSYTYYIPYKSEWVEPPRLNVPWRSHFEVLMDINLRMIKENAPLVWMKKSETEFEKFFVVWW